LSPTSDRAFTLIELLIVVVIIAILIAIFWPIRGDREKWRLASCENNLKQLALGLLIYSNDAAEHLPPVDRWALAVRPYVKSGKLFTCPGDDSRWLRHGGGPYAMSSALDGAAPPDVPYEQQPPMLWDSGPDGEFAKRHGRGGVICFADGHVKLCKEQLPGMERGLVGLQP
jgi:prepilin-type N-terminal cleavage/methylation domain-containing protein/prepilin-type processing-associated H-X9-DG protein